MNSVRAAAEQPVNTVSLEQILHRRNDLPADRQKPGRDLVTLMLLARSRPDILAHDLRAMGYSANGDNFPDED
jgi:hypothetical protein